MAKTYEADFYSWALDQADALKRRSPNELDWENLAEELATLGRSEANQLHSRFVVLLLHLLKWRYQPTLRGASWKNSIDNQRFAVARLLRRNPGLKSLEAEEFADAYVMARRDAANETGLAIETFPEQPPFTPDEARDEAWWPD